jgi:hypothetical protein
MKRQSVLVLSIFLYIIVQAQDINKRQTDSINFNNDLESLMLIDELLDISRESHFLTLSWVHIYIKPEATDKLRLLQIHQEIVPNLLERLELMSKNWDETEIKLYSEIEISLKDLFSIQNYIMNSLNSPDSYEDINVLYEIYPMLEPEGQIEKKEKVIFDDLTNLKKTFYTKVKNYSSSVNN